MQILRGHKAVVRVLAFSPDGKWLASGGEDETIRLWQFPEGVEWDRLESPPYLLPSLAFSSDSRWLAAPAPAPEAVWVWELANPSERWELPLTGRGTDGHHFPDTVTFSPDGKRLLLSGGRGLRWQGGRYERTEALLRSWRVPTWEEAQAGDFVIPSDVAWSRPWVLSPGGAVLATPDYRSEVLFWDTATGQELFQVTNRSGSAPAALAFSPDGRRFAAAWARTILTCDVTAQKALANWQNPTPKHIQSLAFSPDGRTLATVSKDTTARLWDAATGRETAAYAWDIGPLNAVAFAADGMRAAVSGKKGTILVWDVE
jgi:WD40 repeat protein